MATGRAERDAPTPNFFFFWGGGGGARSGGIFGGAETWAGVLGGVGGVGRLEWGGGGVSFCNFHCLHLLIYPKLEADP